jgi:hypothetical protein
MTAVFSGSLPDAAADRELAAVQGLLYAVSYLSFVLLTPPLIAAAVLLAIWEALQRARERC